jgi:hypothetical protein
MGSDHRLAFSVNLVAGIDPVTKNINWLAEMRNIASISLPTYCAFYHAFPCELIHLSEHGLFMVAERTRGAALARYAPGNPSPTSAPAFAVAVCTTTKTGTSLLSAAGVWAMSSLVAS